MWNLSKRKHVTSKCWKWSFYKQSLDRRRKRQEECVCLCSLCALRVCIWIVHSVGNVTLRSHAYVRHSFLNSSWKQNVSSWKFNLISFGSQKFPTFVVSEVFESLRVMFVRSRFLETRFEVREADMRIHYFLSQKKACNKIPKKILQFTNKVPSIYSYNQWTMTQFDEGFT